MNSRLDWLVLSDYYLIYVTNAPPKKANRFVFIGSLFFLGSNQHFTSCHQVLHNTIPFTSVALFTESL